MFSSVLNNDIDAGSNWGDNQWLIQPNGEQVYPRPGFSDEFINDPTNASIINTFDSDEEDGDFPLSDEDWALDIEVGPPTPPPSTMGDDDDNDAEFNTGAGGPPPRTPLYLIPPFQPLNDFDFEEELGQPDPQFGDLGEHGDGIVMPDDRHRLLLYDTNTHRCDNGVHRVIYPHAPGVDFDLLSWSTLKREFDMDYEAYRSFNGLTRFEIFHIFDPSVAQKVSAPSQMPFFGMSGMEFDRRRLCPMLCCDDGMSVCTWLHPEVLVNNKGPTPIRPILIAEVNYQDTMEYTTRNVVHGYYELPAMVDPDLRKAQLVMRKLANTPDMFIHVLGFLQTSEVSLYASMFYTMGPQLCKLSYGVAPPTGEGRRAITRLFQSLTREEVDQRPGVTTNVFGAGLMSSLIELPRQISREDCAWLGKQETCPDREWAIKCMVKVTHEKAAMKKLMARRRTQPRHVLAKHAGLFDITNVINRAGVRVLILDEFVSQVRLLSRLIMTATTSLTIHARVDYSKVHGFRLEDRERMMAAHLLDHTNYNQAWADMYLLLDISKCIDGADPAVAMKKLDVLDRLFNRYLSKSVYKVMLTSAEYCRDCPLISNLEALGDWGCVMGMDERQTRKIRKTASVSQYAIQCAGVIDIDVGKLYLHILRHNYFGDDIDCHCAPATGNAASEAWTKIAMYLSNNFVAIRFIDHYRGPPWPSMEAQADEHEERNAAALLGHTFRHPQGHFSNVAGLIPGLAQIVHRDGEVAMPVPPTSFDCRPGVYTARL